MTKQEWKWLGITIVVIVAVMFLLRAAANAQVIEVPDVPVMDQATPGGEVWPDSFTNFNPNDNGDDNSGDNGGSSGGGGRRTRHSTSTVDTLDPVLAAYYQQIIDLAWLILAYYV